MPSTNPASRRTSSAIRSPHWPRALVLTRAWRRWSAVSWRREVSRAAVLSWTSSSPYCRARSLSNRETSSCILWMSPFMVERFWSMSCFFDSRSFSPRWTRPSRFSRASLRSSPVLALSASWDRAPKLSRTRPRSASRSWIFSASVALTRARAISRVSFFRRA